MIQRIKIFIIFARVMYRLIITHRLRSWAILLIILCVGTVNGQDVTLSNNLLYDAALTPNLQVGVQVAPKWSLGFTAGFNPWPTGNLTKKKWRHLLLSPEVRHWKDSLQVGEFWGANIIYSHFNAGYTDFLLYKGVKDERRQGDLMALGGFYGYSWQLGTHWTFEAFGGLALGYAWYDRFEMDEHGDAWKPIGDSGKLFILPQLGLSFVYHFPARPKKQKDSYGILKSSDIERK